ncbi:unnamed protein product [Adineta ricciae]|uniref:Flavin-containing monooxygenase n=1 Tax=Adineta ricciae TaxID=249248 RepID=A0A814W5F1_ADIRI|nr:unnamed protein product [Adineta ricciae]
MANSTKKTVAVIGAGVSGLVSAVQMHRVGIQPVIFEKASNIGGMWNSDERPCWKSMRTNISKFSAALSDHSWSRNTSLFPNQPEVYSYLSDYAQKSLPEDIFRFNTKVNGYVSFEQFDYVIIASGFFNSPYTSAKISNLSSFPGTIMHSSDYRSSDQVRGKRVFIVGGSMSAVDIAGDMATNAKHITHISPHSFWVIPRVIPIKPSDRVSPFLPIDFVYYRRSIRASSEETVIRTKDQNRTANGNLRLVTGNMQKSSMLSDANDENPVFTTISDMYSPWTRMDRIVLQEGRSSQVTPVHTAPPISEHPDWICSLKLNNGKIFPTMCDDILVLCTGYQTCLDYFSEDILQDLSYRPDDPFCPLILHRSVFHPTLPNLAFIGMYRGVFWAVAELQARWVASIFAGLLPSPSIAAQQIGLEVERTVRAQQPRPQFPHSDYVGLINDLAKEILLTNSSDIVIPAQYCSTSPDQSVIDEMNNLCEEANSGRFIAGVVFRALHNTKWTFERTLTGKPSDGTVRGQAEFLFFSPNKLLYKEQGKLTLSSQMPLDITQKYIYSYDEEKDLLTVYFVNEDSQLGSLFHTIHFQSKENSSNGWLASGEHLCSQDHYSTSYLFALNGVNLSEFEITYTVKGPAKDYVSKTVFQPIKDHV